MLIFSDDSRSDAGRLLDEQIRERTLGARVMYIDPRTADVAAGASILATRFDAGFVEGTDVAFSRTAAGGAHASQ